MTKEKNQSRKQVYKCYFTIHQPLTQNPTQYPKCCDASHSWIPLRFPGGSFLLSSVSQSVAWSCWVTPGSWAHSCDSCPFVDTRRHRCCTGLQRAAAGLEWLWLRSKHSKITFIQHSIFKEIRKNHCLGVITLRRPTSYDASESERSMKLKHLSVMKSQLGRCRLNIADLLMVSDSLCTAV